MERLTKRTAAGTPNLDYPKSCYYDSGDKDKVAVSAFRQRAIDRLAHYEDLEEQGRLVILPCGNNAVLMRDGKEYTADHWNHSLSAFRNEPTNRSGKQVALFSIAEAEAALSLQKRITGSVVEEDE